MWYIFRYFYLKFSRHIKVPVKTYLVLLLHFGCFFDFYAKFEKILFRERCSLSSSIFKFPYIFSRPVFFLFLFPLAGNHIPKYRDKICRKIHNFSYWFAFFVLLGNNSKKFVGRRMKGLHASDYRKRSILRRAICHIILWKCI